MMKIIAIVMCMSVLVASQDFGMGDGLGGLMMMNMLSGGQFNLNSLFGGAPRAAPPAAAARTGARVATQRGAAGSPLNSLAGLYVLGAL